MNDLTQLLLLSGFCLALIQKHWERFLYYRGFCEPMALSLLCMISALLTLSFDKYMGDKLDHHNIHTSVKCIWKLDFFFIVKERNDAVPFSMEEYNLCFCAFPVQFFTQIEGFNIAILQKNETTPVPLPIPKWKRHGRILASFWRQGKLRRLGEGVDLPKCPSLLYTI